MRFQPRHTSGPSAARVGGCSPRIFFVLLLLSRFFLPPPRLGASIEGVPTNVAGFVGMAAKGPIDKPALVESWEQFADLFGDFAESLPNPYLAPSVLAFFENGGRRCYVVRVAADTDASYYVLNFLFQGGPPMRAPFPDCGADPTADSLGCERYADCP